MNKKIQKFQFGNLINPKFNKIEQTVTQFNQTLDQIKQKAAQANKERDKKRKQEREKWMKKQSYPKPHVEIVPNDNIWVNTGRPKNPERKVKVQGPDWNSPWIYAGMGLGAVPLGVASAPLVAGIAEAAPVVLANPYVDAAIGSAFAGNGTWDMITGNANWMTPLEMMPLAGPAFKGINWLSKAGTKQISNIVSTAIPKTTETLFEPKPLQLSGHKYVSPVTRRVSFNTNEPIMTNKSVSARITKNVPTEEPVYIEESVPVKEPITINIRNLIRDADKERWGDNYKRVNLEELQKVAKQRIGRELTDQELNQFVGGHYSYAFPEFRHRSNIHEPLQKTGDAIIDIESYGNPESTINKLVGNFNKLTDKNTMRTKIGQGRYSESDLQSMLNEDGTFKDNVMLQETYPGAHGVDNWYDSDVGLNENIRRWFNTKYNTGSQQSIMKENPIKDSSGLVIKGKDGDFSIDSFFSALKFLRMALNSRGAGRKFFKLNKQLYKPDYIRANDLGQRFRYEEIDFDPEFSELVKKTLKDQEIKAIQNNRVSEGKLPEGTEIGRINSPGNKNHGNIIIRHNGKKVGMLRPKTAEEIAGYGEGKNRVPGIYDKLIDELNNTYGLDIKYPQGYNGMIQWPDIRGILYKKGGNINVFSKNIPAHRKKLKITCGLS